ncbi:MAG: ABC transporter substrate-binding protein [Clostridia bacterium]|nr:ABC transporter substrate-binding protein [Clostridia bacterium]
MKKRLLPIVLAILLSLQTTACTSGTVQETGPVTLTDQCGRNVSLDERAETIVSCYYVSSYAVMALGLADRMVGIENKADTREIYTLASPAFLELPAVGTMKESNVELIASLEPDLVIMPAKLAEAAETLTGLGLDVILVNPENHEDLCGMLELIGDACGVSDRADALISYYDDQRETLADLTADADKPTVYMGGNSSYLTTAPAGMYQSSLIDIAGGENAGAGLEGDYWTEVSYETILSMDPEVIVLPSGAEYTVEDILNDAQLAGVAAVESGAVYAMPSSIEEWDSPIPSGILGAMWLTSVLHPDLYTSETFCKDAIEFYEEFYGFTPDEALLK